MAVVIVATVGSASANSFATLVEALTYLEGRSNASAYVGADPDDQNVALVEATRDVSALAFKGERVTETQALAWPRSSAPKPDGPYGAYFSTTEIPAAVKAYTIELALQYLKAGTTDAAAPSSNANVIRRKVGPIETEWANPSQRAQGLARYPRFELITPLLAAVPGQVRLVR